MLPNNVSLDIDLKNFRALCNRCFRIEELESNLILFRPKLNVITFKENMINYNE
jgi:hypothetical protein